MPEMTKVGGPPQTADLQNSTTETAENKTDESHSTPGTGEIATLAGVPLLQVEVLEPDGRRRTPALIGGPCSRCGHRHLCRGELGVRRLPCGLVVVVVAEGGEQR